MKQILRKALARTVAKLPRGVFTDRRHFEIFQSAGVHMTPVHFYQPVPDTSQIDPTIWDKPVEMIGVDQNLDGQASLLSEFSSSGFIDEFHRLPLACKVPTQYGRDNGFGGADGAMLYSMIRKYRPSQIVEIGAGQSTLLSLLAMETNGEVGRITSIDPFPQPYLKSILDPRLTLFDKRVEHVPLETFESLGENDILFIDSSHVVRIGGDVIYEILEILPRLRRGVLIHIHDIFLPVHYPKHWVMDEHIFWTEQYLILAFLAFNSTFKVLWGYGMMDASRPNELRALFPGAHTFHGSSLWITKTG